MPYARPAVPKTMSGHSVLTRGLESLARGMSRARSPPSMPLQQYVAYPGIIRSLILLLSCARCCVLLDALFRSTAILFRGLHLHKQALKPSSLPLQLCIPAISQRQLFCVSSVQPFSSKCPKGDHRFLVLLHMPPTSFLAGEGLTKHCDKFPCTIRLINRFLGQQCASHSWENVAISHNCAILPHRDAANLPTSHNVSLALVALLVEASSTQLQA